MTNHTYKLNIDFSNENESIYTLTLHDNYESYDNLKLKLSGMLQDGKGKVLAIFKDENGKEIRLKF